MLAVNDHLFALEAAALDLVQALKNTPQYGHYQLASKQVHKDTELGRRIQAFQQLVDIYEEATRHSKDVSHLSALRQQVLACKKQLDLHPAMVQLRYAEVDFQKLLAQVTQSLAEAVSPTIFVDTGLPLAAKKAPHPQGIYKNIKEKDQR